MGPHKVDRLWLVSRMLAAAVWWGFAGAGVGAIWGAAFDNMKAVVMWSGIGAAIFGGLVIGPATYRPDTSFGHAMFLITVALVAAVIGGIVWLIR